GSLEQQGECAVGEAVIVLIGAVDGVEVAAYGEGSVVLGRHLFGDLVRDAPGLVGEWAEHAVNGVRHEQRHGADVERYRAGEVLAIGEVDHGADLGLAGRGGATIGARQRVRAAARLLESAPAKGVVAIEVDAPRLDCGGDDPLACLAAVLAASVEV